MYKYFNYNGCFLVMRTTIIFKYLHSSRAPSKIVWVRFKTMGMPSVNRCCRYCGTRLDTNNSAFSVKRIVLHSLISVSQSITRSQSHSYFYNETTRCGIITGACEKSVLGRAAKHRSPIGSAGWSSRVRIVWRRAQLSHFNRCARFVCAGLTILIILTFVRFSHPRQCETI